MTAVGQTRRGAGSGDKDTERTLGRYQLIEAIASGGMGTVHLARVIGTSDPVAVKLLHAHLAAERRFVAMFFEEADP